MRRILPAVALLLVSCGDRHPVSVPLDARVTAEIARVEQSLARLDPAALPAEARGEVKLHREQLARARSSSDPDVRLFRLRTPFIGTEALALLTSDPAANRDAKAFEASWKRKQALFEAKKPVASISLLHRALEQQAANRAEKYFRASLAYGKAAGPFSGAYYLAEGESNLRFRDFVASLPHDPTNEPMPRRDAVDAALKRLESEAVTAYARDPKERATVMASASLKEARELLAQDLIEGASLALLEARFALSRTKTFGGVPAIAATDESIPALFSAIASEPKNPQAASIHADVLPLYTALFAPPPAVQRTRATVTVTLVRWPYT